MLQEGVDLNFISNITGLSLDGLRAQEIQKLQMSIKPKLPTKPEVNFNTHVEFSENLILNIKIVCCMWVFRNLVYK